MKKIQEILEANKVDGKAKLTKNNELYLEVLLGVVTDESYKAEIYEGYEDGKIKTMEKEIAKDFKKFVAKILRISGMTEEEAKEAAAGYKPKKSEIGVIIDAVRETDYLMTAKLGKKVNLIKKVGLEADFSVSQVGEKKYANPQDRTKIVTVAPRQKVAVHSIVHPWLKQK